jgi:predicted ATP-dependent endonuclease of OLD family
MNGKVLPIESLGSGIHEVIILAVACTLHDETVICLEEPELHLNPLLQKKLIRYLQKSTTNQYFITTHSAAFMDVKDAEIYHVRLENGQSIVRHITADQHRAQICWDLGYHPSDLLQTNSIIWVEGPSDRIYLNWWLSKKAPELLEGVHFSIMFYGGQLSHHITGGDETELLKDFISLSKMNRNSAILLDSDKNTARALLKANTQRLKKSFEEQQRLCWITQGREVENYLPAEQVAKALGHTHPESNIATALGVYDNRLTIKAKRSKSKEVQASKVKVAQYIAENFQPDFTVLDLASRLDGLIRFIKNANPKTSVESFKS